MLKFKSNHKEVADEAAKVANGLGFDRVGRYRSLGDDIADLIAEGEFDRTVMDQQEPSGAPLARLNEAYLRDKVRRGFPSAILVRTKAMLALAELRGEVRVNTTDLEMTYGTNEETRQKAEWAHKGSRKRRRPKRPFVGLDQRITEDLGTLVDEALDKQMEAMGF